MCESPQLYSFRNRLWLGLMLGNSRRHWAKLCGQTVLETWDEDNTEPPPTLKDDLPLIVASVVCEPTQYWARFPQVRVLTLADIPLNGMYSTLGIDRALAVLGAGTQYGWPILVIDAGTALTFTAADADQRLVGGAILPGLGLQRSSLAQKTATLPRVEFSPPIYRHAGLPKPQRQFRAELFIPCWPECGILLKPGKNNIPRGRW